MFATLSRTWELTKESFAVLRADKEILLFPVMSSIAAIVVTASFFIPLFMTGAFQSLQEGGETSPFHYLVLFVFYFANYFVIIFFNSALMACANIRLSGGDPTVADGLRIAQSRLGRIAAWALVAATVGMILRAIEERSQKLGQLVTALIGAAWTLLTYFMIPVILFEDLSIGDSIKRSGAIFRKNWGEQVTGGFSFGLIFFLLLIPGVIITAVLVAVIPLVGVLFAVVYFLGLAAISAAVKGIFTVALYRYATNGEVPAGFSPALVQGAFTPKGVIGLPS
jgi:hypothetical protein